MKTIRSSALAINSFLLVRLLCVIDYQLVSGNNMFLTSKCKDDETFLYKNDEGKDCAWLNQKRKRKKNELCKNANVLKACPETCGACETTCPLIFFSSEFDQSCSKYKDGLTCHYNYIYTGCMWDSLQCTSQQFYECDQSEWLRESTMVALCEKPPKDLPLYEECEPCPKVEPADECQSIRPDNGSKCTQVGLECKYGFMLTGCNLEELQCSPTEWYSCTEENFWIVAMADMAPCPETLTMIPEILTTISPETTLTSETTCPLNYFSSEFDQSCSKYKDGLTCHYDYIYTGCTWDSLQCTSQQFYECDQSEWLRASTMVALCENPPKDLPLYEECEPCPKVEPADECPSIQPDNGSKCTQVGLQCRYNFMLTGCNLEELQCSPIEWYFCTEENVWMVAMSAMAPCPETLTVIP